VEGLLLGNAVPKGIQKFVHPLITCAVFSNVAVVVFAAAAGWGYQETLRLYLTKVMLSHRLGSEQRRDHRPGYLRCTAECLQS